MAQTVMYSGINNSPKASLTAGITASDQVIPISDAAFFPDGPNIATIGVEDDAELIRYAAKSGNTLTGCERGFHGTTAKVWNQNDVVYRGFALYDHDAFRANIADLVVAKLDKTGDGSNATVAFSTSGSRIAITTGEKLSVLFGKLAKWLADLKALAFKATVSTSDIDAASVTNAKLSNMASGTLKGNNAGASATPVDIDASGVRTMLNVADGADVTGAILEDAPAIDAVADGDKLIIEDISAVSGSQTKHLLWSSIKTALSALYAPKIHNRRHHTGGEDALAPTDIGAATAEHASQHGTDGADPTAWMWSKTLTAAGWSNSRQDILIAVTEANVVLITGVTDADKTAFSNAGISVSHITGGLRFTATAVPGSAINLSIAAV